MTRQKLKAAMAMMADRENAARDVAAQLGVSLSTLYAYVDAKGGARPRATALLEKRKASRLPADLALYTMPASKLEPGSILRGHEFPL